MKNLLISFLFSILLFSCEKENLTIYYYNQISLENTKIKYYITNDKYLGKTYDNKNCYKFIDCYLITPYFYKDTLLTSLKYNEFIYKNINFNK